MKKLLILSACAFAPLVMYARSDRSFLDDFDLQGILIFSVLSFVVYVIVTRLVFSIPTFLKYQKVQTLLLIKIAKQEKISDQELDTILNVIEDSGHEAGNSNTIRGICRKMSQSAKDNEGKED